MKRCHIEALRSLMTHLLLETWSEGTKDGMKTDSIMKINLLESEM